MNLKVLALFHHMVTNGMFKPFNTVSIMLNTVLSHNHMKSWLYTKITKSHLHSQILATFVTHSQSVWEFPCKIFYFQIFLFSYKNSLQTKTWQTKLSMRTFWKPKFKNTMLMNFWIRPKRRKIFVVLVAFVYKEKKKTCMSQKVWKSKDQKFLFMALFLYEWSKLT